MKSAPPPEPRRVAERVTGPAHVWAAATYSAGGLRCLWRETAFRHEMLGLAVCIVVLLAVGASLVEHVALVALFLALFAVEALNTAIERIVDLVSPDWDERARDAKDLGSLTVACLLAVVGLYVAVVVLRHLGVI